MRLEAEEAKRKAQEERQQREEERRREDERLAEASARLEQTRRLAAEEMDILRIQRELEAKKQAYSDAQRAAAIDVDDAGDEDGSDSAPEDQPVRYPFIYSLYCILITLHLSIRGPPSRTRHVRRKRLADGCLRLLTQR
jgi:hypothetical protein